MIILKMISSETVRAKICAILYSPTLALSLAALFWSGNFVAGRALCDQINPLTLNFLRRLIALAIIAPFVWQSISINLKILKREWLLILMLGATGIASFHALVYLALQNATATNALLMLSLAPIMTLIGSKIFEMEYLTVRQLSGISISIIGAGVLITRGNFNTIILQGFNSGDLWMLLAVVIWTAYSLILSRRPTDLPSSTTLTASIVAALVMMAPFLVFDSQPLVSAPGSFSTLLSIGYIAIFASVIAFLLWSYGLSQLGPTRTGQFVNLMPIFGAGLAFIILGEIPTTIQMIGAILVLSGIVIVEYPTHKDHSTTMNEQFR